MKENVQNPKQSLGNITKGQERCGYGTGDEAKTSQWEFLEKMIQMLGD